MMVLRRVSRVAQSVWCLATGWTTGRSKLDPRQRQMIFPVTSVYRPALGSTQPPVQWVPGVLSPGVKRGRDVTLNTHPPLVPRSRKVGATPIHPSVFVACSGTALAFTYFDVSSYNLTSVNGSWNRILKYVL
jgi:hypothetical protein